VFRQASNIDLPEVQSLVSASLQEFGRALDFDSSDADLLDLEATYVQPGGSFLLAEDQAGHLLGMVALKPLNSSEVMLRKMYVASSARGQGLGRKLLEQALATAREKGFKAVLLETMGTMHAAIALYESAGFQSTNLQPTSPRCDRVYRLVLS
jgi:ribosomal protein S18 acetylase RimI-like enzyme